MDVGRLQPVIVNVVTGTGAVLLVMLNLFAVCSLFSLDYSLFPEQFKYLDKAYAASSPIVPDAAPPSPRRYDGGHETASRGEAIAQQQRWQQRQ